jgi:prephenate dehydrogenase
MVVAHHLTELLRKDQKPDEYEKFISMIERLDFSEISEDNFESFMMLFNSNPELL